jgi:hypothetical protein
MEFSDVVECWKSCSDWEPNRNQLDDRRYLLWYYYVRKYVRCRAEEKRLTKNDRMAAAESVGIAGGWWPEKL